MTGEEARAVWRAAEAASAGTTRRAGGIGLALATRPPVTTTGDDEASRHAISLALNAAGGPATATAAEDGGGRGARRRERRSASELGTAVAAKRLVAHVTQPVLWEPGVTYSWWGAGMRVGVARTPPSLSYAKPRRRRARTYVRDSRGESMYVV